MATLTSDVTFNHLPASIFDQPGTIASFTTFAGFDFYGPGLIDLLDTTLYSGLPSSTEIILTDGSLFNAQIDVISGSGFSNPLLGFGFFTTSSTQVFLSTLNTQDGDIAYSLNGVNFSAFDTNGIPHAGTLNNISKYVYQAATSQFVLVGMESASQGIDMAVFGDVVLEGALPVLGSVTGWLQERGDVGGGGNQPHFDIAGFDVDILTLYSYILLDDLNGLASEVFVGSDSLMGSSSDDQFGGYDGDDTIWGLMGRDTIFGDDGHDQINGGTGSDAILGGNGDDVLFGGPDQILPSRIDYADTLSGGSGGDLIAGGGGDDVLSGDSGDDSISGDPGRDAMSGGDGADTVHGFAGHDTAYGGAGADDLRGGFGRDLLNGSGDDDAVRGFEGDDRLFGGGGNDTLLGGDNNDSLIGGGGADRLKGDAANDTLNGSFGADSLTGGAGDDVIEFRKTHGADIVDDFAAGAASEDVIKLIAFGTAFDSFAEVIAASAQAGADVVIDFGGGDTLTLIGVTLGSLHTDDFTFG